MTLRPNSHPGFLFRADAAGYHTRLCEHRATIERRLGLRAFERADRGMTFTTASDVAASTDRCDAIVAAMVEQLRGPGVVLPVLAVLKGIALFARAAARRQAFARLGRDLTPNQVERLMPCRGSGEHPPARLWPSYATGRKHAVQVTLKRSSNDSIMTAQHLTRLEGWRRLATLVAFAIEMEMALTDAAILMVEKLVHGMFRRADRTRSERLIDQVRLFRDTVRLHIRLGRTRLDARGTDRNALALIDDRIGWAALEQSLRAAEKLTRPARTASTK